MVSDVEAGEPIWAGHERKRETLDRFFAEYLPARRRTCVRAVCVDMWEPFIQSLREHLPEVAIVFGKFHVMSTSTAPWTRPAGRNSSARTARCAP